MEVIILAGGLGTRLRSMVSDVPKCMAPVAGRPFLWYILTYLKRFDVTRVILSVGYLKEVIFRWIEEHGGEWPFEIDYAAEESPLGTGGAIRLALSKCREDYAVILNGDTFFDVDLNCLIRERDAAVTLVLKRLNDFDRYGAVEMDVQSSAVTAFREKCHCEDGLINGGVYRVDRRLPDMSPLPERYSFETDVLQPLSKEGAVSAIVCDGYFIDIGVPDDYKRAQIEFLDVRGYDTLLLDRDGVINRLRENDYVKTWEEFEFLPGVIGQLARWSSLVRRIIVVTNQRGVGKGLYTGETLDDIHRRMILEIERGGGRIDAVYYCTSLTDDDPRRKPGIGMYLDICRDFPEVRCGRTLMVGDSDTDEKFAAGCGIDFVRV